MRHGGSTLHEDVLVGDGTFQRTCGRSAHRIELAIAGGRNAHPTVERATHHVRLQMCRDRGEPHFRDLAGELDRLVLDDTVGEHGDDGDVAPDETHHLHRTDDGDLGTRAHHHRCVV